VPLLVDVIQKGSPDSMEYAAGALINLTIPELSKYIIECDGVDVLVNGLIKDGPLGHKLNCATALGNLFSDDKLANELWDKGCVAECLKLVEDADDRVRINAMMALSRFAAFNMNFKKRIFDVSKGEFGKFICFFVYGGCWPGDCQILCIALRLHSPIVVSGGLRFLRRCRVGALVSILVMDTEACRCNAAGAFWNMTSAVDMPLHVFEAGVGPKLLKLLKEAEDTETRHMAMGVGSALCDLD